ncbi:uncharacterized protein LOC125202095 isoform X3 [Salvia hispanica]|uniref:uncharacterized protein LOC125202095 isoform X3 n=1 Tax=Salvia hispanica TaxID=49212 RepID=UPI0020098C0A|nr:uncharacterized protein LOC125202095 isoform X3 [Salvia hispanica]
MFIPTAQHDILFEGWLLVSYYKPLGYTKGQSLAFRSLSLICLHNHCSALWFSEIFISPLAYEILVFISQMVSHAEQCHVNFHQVQSEYISFFHQVQNESIHSGKQKKIEVLELSYELTLGGGAFGNRLAVNADFIHELWSELGKYLAFKSLKMNLSSTYLQLLQKKSLYIYYHARIRKVCKMFNHMH